MVGQARHLKGSPVGGRWMPTVGGGPAAVLNDEPVGEYVSLNDLMESAARLQELVPDAVVVGGSAAAFYAKHRLSTDHDHVLSDLQERFDMVLDALEGAEGEWVTNRVVPGKIILGRLGDIEAGIRQLRREKPLEVAQYLSPNGSVLTVPTLDETLRIKAYLMIKRNQTRDYLDVAALAHTAGRDRAAAVLNGIDAYYDDLKESNHGVATQVAIQLADPKPADLSSIPSLSVYKGLHPYWSDWDTVVTTCQNVADAMCFVLPPEV